MKVENQNNKPDIEDIIAEKIFSSKNINLHTISDQDLKTFIKEKVVKANYIQEDSVSDLTGYVKDYAVKRIMEKIEKKILLKYSLASWKKRLVHLIVDYILIYIFFIIFLFFIPSFLMEGETIGVIMIYFLGGLISIAYYMIFEYFWFRTPAKFITKTRVITVRGKNPEPKDILIRTLCRYIPFEIFSFLSEKPRGWHDRFSNTIVINDTSVSKKIPLEKKERNKELGVNFCSNCGTKTDKDSKFCKHCGKKI